MASEQASTRSASIEPSSAFFICIPPAFSFDSSHHTRDTHDAHDTHTRQCKEVYIGLEEEVEVDNLDFGLSSQDGWHLGAQERPQVPSGRRKHRVMIISDVCVVCSVQCAAYRWS
jgi:hypothetical protein